MKARRPVVINEALEAGADLQRRRSRWPFVNGVLDAIRRTIEKSNV